VVAEDQVESVYGARELGHPGGDGYVELADGQGTTRNLMANDLLAYITGLGTISPTTDASTMWPDWASERGPVERRGRSSAARTGAQVRSRRYFPKCGTVNAIRPRSPE
jgi:hypothetical protein